MTTMSKSERPLPSVPFLNFWAAKVYKQHNIYNKCGEQGVPKQYIWAAFLATWFWDPTHIYSFWVNKKVRHVNATATTRNIHIHSLKNSWGRLFCLCWRFPIIHLKRKVGLHLKAAFTPKATGRRQVKVDAFQAPVAWNTSIRWLCMESRHYLVFLAGDKCVVVVVVVVVVIARVPVWALGGRETCVTFNDFLNPLTILPFTHSQCGRHCDRSYLLLSKVGRERLGFRVTYYL